MLEVLFTQDSKVEDLVCRDHSNTTDINRNLFLGNVPSDDVFIRPKDAWSGKQCRP